MNHSFNISQLEILSHLTFDACILYKDLQKAPQLGQLEFKIERRTHENVRRSKFLFWDRTKYQGRSSLLKFSGIESVKVIINDERFRDNYFINQIQLNKKTGNVELSATFGLTVRLKPNNHFKVELQDTHVSDFGVGVAFGKFGFTKEEWRDYLIEKNYQ